MSQAHHPLIQTWIDLKGNPRACIRIEPLWGIAYNLFAPFLTLYMSNLGVTDAQIGLLLTIGMIVQLITSLIGGILIDKMGRRLSSLVLGLLAWTVPPAIWMLSQNVWWFLAAAVFNGVNLIESVAWNCLLVEDAEQDKLVDMYNWVTIAGLLAVFFAPLAGLMVRVLSLVSAMRIIFGFALVLMTVKTVLLYFKSRETRQGRVRMEETRGVPFFKLLRQYRGVFRQIVSRRDTLVVLAIITLIHITNLINNNFFALFATSNAAVPDWFISYFPMVRSAVMLVFFFGIQNWISRFPLRQAMLVGLAFYLASIAFLLLSPIVGNGLLAGYILLDASAFALVWPRRNSLVAMHVDPLERARILGLLYVVMITLASPFGWMAGWLSEINRALPYGLNAILYAVCALILFRFRSQETAAAA